MTLSVDVGCGVVHVWQKYDRLRDRGAIEAIDDREVEAGSELLSHQAKIGGNLIAVT